MEIDYDRLELIVAGYIDESIRKDFDISKIVRMAEIKPYRGQDAIIVDLNGRGMFAFDPITYEQIGGMGGVEL